MSTSAERVELIAEIEKVRASRVMTYVTSTRPGQNRAQMSMDDIPVIHQHVEALDLGPREEARLDLFLITYGGAATVPWRLMTLLREYAQEVNVLVPFNASSAGTLACLGADNVI